MHGDLVTEAALSGLRCVVVVVSHRSLIKSLAAYMLLFTALFIMQPISMRAGDFASIGKSPEQYVNSEIATI